jgi:hypothetical protein
MKAGKVTKAESRTEVTSQLPREATRTQQSSGEAQRLRAGVGLTGPPHKVGQVLDPGADLMGQRAAFKTELTSLVGGGADQTELQLKDNAAATWRKQQQL